MDSYLLSSPFKRYYYEKKESYLVTYYLKTNAKAAMIQFYWNKNEQITGAMLILTDGTNYEKLNKVITEIEKLTGKEEWNLIISKYKIIIASL